ncbi:MAG: HAD family hydrolase [Clostridiales bacterium]|nr:HAD family hydrolase [Clostridiales bacterium]
MIILEGHDKLPVRAAIFDFDGTISTLRCGWEKVMAPLMCEYILGGHTERSDEIKALVDSYIDESTGIQTALQMKWLNDTIKQYGLNPGAPDDQWFYKDEYNRRLMLDVARKRDEVESGAVPKGNYIICGAENFFEALRDRGVTLYAASGTDDADVKRESAALGFFDYFTEIAGAKPRAEDCSKDAVIKRLISEGGYKGGELLVVGDGKVEIMLGRAAGAVTLGLATDEVKRCGINPVKEKRLRAAGAHAVTGDFTHLDNIMNWLF